jgi:hypothetical protein
LGEFGGERFIETMLNPSKPGSKLKSYNKSYNFEEKII